MDTKSRSRRLTAVFFCTLLTFALLLSGCIRQAGTGPDGGERIISGETGEFYENQRPDDPEFTAFCDRLFKEEMSGASTLDLHYTLLRPAAYGIEPGEASLGSVSLPDLIAETQAQKELKEELLKFDPSSLSRDQNILYDCLMENLNTSLLGAGMELYEQPLAPTIGVQAQLPILLAEYSFHSLDDAEDYLALLSQVDSYYGELLAFETMKAEAGLAPSDASIDAIIASCQSYLINPEENFLTETFKARLNSLAQNGTEISDETLADLNDRHKNAIREHFIPAYERLIVGMEALKGRGLRDGGLCALADGKQYYEYLLKTGPGLSLSVEELRAALTRQMEEDLKAIGRLTAAYPNLEADLSSAAFSLSDPQAILSDLQKQMKPLFPPVPSREGQEVRYEVRSVPEHLEESLSPAFYLTAPVDDLSRNVIYINNGSPASSDSLYTTLAHEGFPGHLYQTVYSRAAAPHPLASILSCSGANEGWATYVENIACLFDNGLPPGVGEYQARSRSFSLCAHGLLDIGVNYDGWDVEKAKEFITSCFAVDDETVASLWQTMVDNPANYLEYCGGYVEFMEMRRKAEQTLGDRFSPLEFHRFILELGPVPFPVMEKYFEEWLENWTNS